MQNEPSFLQVSYSLSEEAKDSEKQGILWKGLWKGLCSKTRSNCTMVCFPFLACLFNPQKRQLVTSCWHYDRACHPGSDMLQSTKAAADGSALQSSQTSRACVVMCPVTARTPNWGCTPNGAFRAKVIKAFPVSKQMALPQCCLKNTDLF